MEEDQEPKHMCKFCNKSFPCGRSLGGHMRSHMILNSAETDEKLSRRKLLSANNGGGNTNAEDGFDGGTHANYGLRENPKKNCRFADSKDETSLSGKLCKDCGKGFQSWKALFGHMKCHSEKDRVSNSLEEDSWISANQKLVKDSQSDNETEAAAPNRRRRSRRIKRYMTTATSSSFSFANASSSVSEIEQEQEEVAMCLMMLSRDVGHWGGLNSDPDSSDNSSMCLGDPSLLPTDKITIIEGKSGGEFVSLKKQREGRLECETLDSEFLQLDEQNCASGLPKNGRKRIKSKAGVDAFLRSDKIKHTKVDGGCTFEASEVGLGKNLMKEAELDQAELYASKYNSRKRKFQDSYSTVLGSDSSKKRTSDNAFESELCKSSHHKRSKFECTTCNKVFHSYQALGGHRASHRKIKGCFASRIESSETSIETEVSPDAVDDENSIDHDAAIGCVEKVESSHRLKKAKGHECPICFKVFSSGQALGGHKRSHLVGGSEVKNHQAIVIQEPIPEIRDLLDLNLPAPTDEEESNGNVGFKPWWAGSSHKHESLVGLISN
ncbi:uncharacterized protein LOC131146893 [Malania oleifera]|uniref:uncharacterized protein LOC131146893 n=1 Tax=Malania oleifera TaxID=397392 RepID=UPI0025ADF754|nr:uncharacterized protein LOC131146893 [Malania oleifera]